MRNKVICIAVIAIMCGAEVASAGMIDLSKMGIGSSAPSAGAVSLGDLTAARNNATNKYMDVIKSMAGGLASAAGSFGIQNAMSGQLSSINALNPSSINQSSLNTTQSALGSIVGLIKQKMQITPALDAGAKQQYSGAITGLAGALQKGKELLPLLSTFTSQAQGALKGASIQDAAKIGNIAAPVLALAKDFPAELQLGKEALGLLVQYAKAKGIAIPAIASGLLQ